MTTTTIKPSQLSLLLDQTIPAKLPILIVGKPGGGKSDLVEQAANRAGADFILMHPSVSDPTDFKGLPWVVDGKALFLPIGDLDRLLTASKLTVCFTDDVGQAPPAVQAALMQLYLARRINGHSISDHVVFIAATNRRTDRAGVSGILEPVKSRFASIVELQADLDDWCAWAVAHGIAAEVIAFLRFRPAHLEHFEPTADMTNSPCPRTWFRVSQLLRLKLPTSLQVPLFAGAVGHAVAVEFVAFLRVWQQMVSPDLIFTTPETAPIPTEMSALAAVSIALGMRVTAATMGRMCRYLERCREAGKGEYCVPALQAALARDDKLANTDGYIKAMCGPLGQLMVGDAAAA